jgi:hypothetical protein
MEANGKADEFIVVGKQFVVSIDRPNMEAESSYKRLSAKFLKLVTEDQNG